MPTYTVRDPQTGRTVKLTGDSPPTEAELTEVFGAIGQASAPSAETPAPDSALRQLTSDPGGFLAETAGNLVPSAVNTVTGAVRGAGQLVSDLAGSAREMGERVGSGVMRAVGADPMPVSEPTSTRSLMAVIPGILSHYAGYLDPEEAAQRVRDNPVGVAGDAFMGRAAVRGAIPAARRAAAPVRAAAQRAAPVAGPLVGAAAGAMVDGGLSTVAGAALGAAGRPIASLLRRPLSAALRRVLTKTDDAAAAAPVSAAPAATAEAAAPVDRAALAREILAREPNWRTTDAVPIDAIKRDITKGGSIIEAGESRVALGERLAELMKDPSKAADAERIAKAIRQRMHIAGGGRRAPKAK
jgi:hypothetical protein